MKRLVVVGDSDIAKWPEDLIPAGEGGIGTETEWDQPIVSGHSGATLAEVLPHLRRVLAESRTKGMGESGGKTTTSTSTLDTDTVVVVACAGENDIGEGLSLGKSVEALREFANAVFLEHHSGSNLFLLFLGPKFEPWLEHDPSYKKKYEAMARAFRRCLEEYEATTSFCKDDSTNTSKCRSATTNSGGNSNGGRIHFIDCLTMFCGETANVPGARLGGRARADPRFFASDQLHLGNEGYAIWKEVVETKIRGCIAPSN